MLWFVVRDARSVFYSFIRFRNTAFEVVGERVILTSQALFKIFSISQLSSLLWGAPRNCILQTKNRLSISLVLLLLHLPHLAAFKYSIVGGVFRSLWFIFVFAWNAVWPYWVRCLRAMLDISVIVLVLVISDFNKMTSKQTVVDVKELKWATCNCFVSHRSCDVSKLLQPSFHFIRLTATVHGFDFVLFFPSVFLCK